MESPNKGARLEQLWEQLLKLTPTNEQILSVILGISPLEEVAIKRLWQQGATKEDLVSIMVMDSSLARSVQKLLDLRNQRDKTIQQIIEEIKPLTEDS